uniref:CRAL_TRIO_N domain-containing protein n=1 Tax=Elaeophora elaphi TaxID=1147741 RepID=A0A0R3RNC9_9BILA
MEDSADFEEWQLSKLGHFLAVTNIRDTETAVSLLKSLNWDMEKAIEEHILDNTESLSMSSSGSDFVVIDRNSLSTNELTEGFVMQEDESLKRYFRLMDAPIRIYDTDWNTAVAPLPDDTRLNS